MPRFLQSHRHHWFLSQILEIRLKSKKGKNKNSLHHNIEKLDFCVSHPSTIYLFFVFTQNRWKIFRIFVIYPTDNRKKVRNKTGNFTFDQSGVSDYYVYFVGGISCVILWYSCKVLRAIKKKQTTLNFWNAG